MMYLLICSLILLRCNAGDIGFKVWTREYAKFEDPELDSLITNPVRCILCISRGGGIGFKVSTSDHVEFLDVAFDNINLDLMIMI